MAHIEHRLAQAEQRMRNSGIGLAAIPAAWTKLDPTTGELRGPSPDATPGQLATWAIARMMIESVPSRPPAN